VATGFLSEAPPDIFPESFDRQGHRGCRGLMPENTIAAMKKAVDLGVNTLEMDVVVSGDRQVVVSHEAYFSSEITTKPDGTYVNQYEERGLNIFRMDYADIVRYDVGLKPHPRFPHQQKIAAVKPLLSELITNVDTYCTKTGRPQPNYNIEIKSHPDGDTVDHPVPAEFADLVMHVVQRAGIEKRVNIQSFDFRVLHYVHEKYSYIKTGMLVEITDGKSFDDLLAELGFRPHYYSPHYSLVLPGVIRACHDKGIKLVPWTVNETSLIRELTAMGVDGIITDYPDLFI
jgi:glycerophosphoryl diester phosphodiesterase